MVVPGGGDETQIFVPPLLLIPCLPIRVPAAARPRVHRRVYITVLQRLVHRLVPSLVFVPFHARPANLLADFRLSLFVLRVGNGLAQGVHPGEVVALDVRLGQREIRERDLTPDALEHVRRARLCPGGEDFGRSSASQLGSRDFISVDAVLFAKFREVPVDSLRSPRVVILDVPVVVVRLTTRQRVLARVAFHGLQGLVPRVHRVRRSHDDCAFVLKRH